MSSATGVGTSPRYGTGIALTGASWTTKSDANQRTQKMRQAVTAYWAPPMTDHSALVGTRKLAASAVRERSIVSASRCSSDAGALSAASAPRRGAGTVGSVDVTSSRSGSTAGASEPRSCQRLRKAAGSAEARARPVSR